MIDPEIGKDSVINLTDEEMKKYTITGASFNTTLPVGDINIIEGSYADGIKHIYKPQEDITPYELALLLNLFVFASTLSNHSGIPSYDYWGYVKEKGLERHFT